MYFEPRIKRSRAGESRFARSGNVGAFGPDRELELLQSQECHRQRPACDFLYGRGGHSKNPAGRHLPLQLRLHADAFSSGIILWMSPRPPNGWRCVRKCPWILPKPSWPAWSTMWAGCLLHHAAAFLERFYRLTDRDVPRSKSRSVSPDSAMAR